MFKKIFVKKIKNFSKRLISCSTWDQWSNRSWSQEGEDQILRRIFERQSKGFYVDVGAHHPKRFSNTHFFYRLGWQGINIDAMPGSMKAFAKTRARDINLEIGIGIEEGKLDYYIFNEPALNGFSKELSLKRQDSASTYRINEIIKVDVLPLSTILERHLPQGITIDFMTVDVEGLDFEVLLSNDWTKYRPRYVLVEILENNLSEIEQSKIGQFMIDIGYIIYAKCVNTVFFKAILDK